MDFEYLMIQLMRWKCVFNVLECRNFIALIDIYIYALHWRRYEWAKSSDAKTLKCRLKFPSKIKPFSQPPLFMLRNLYHKSDITEHTQMSLIKMLISGKIFRWHLEGFATKLFKWLMMVNMLFFQCNRESF